MKSLSRVRLFETPLTAAHQAPPSMGFSRQENWSGVSLPSPKWRLSIYQIWLAFREKEETSQDEVQAGQHHEKYKSAGGS